MISNIKVLIGYHGTRKRCAEFIQVENAFHISKKTTEWLGDGIYFFEDDFEEALNWAQYNT